MRSVTPDYFPLMMSEPSMAGYSLHPTTRTPRVVVVNQALARRQFPNANPLGRQMQFAGDQKRPPTRLSALWRTRPTESLSEHLGPEIYLPRSGRAARFPSTLCCGPAAIRVRWPPPSAAKCTPSIHCRGRARHDHGPDPTRVGQPREHSPCDYSSGSPWLQPRSRLSGSSGVISLSVGSRVKEIAVARRSARSSSTSSGSF